MIPYRRPVVVALVLLSLPALGGAARAGSRTAEYTVVFDATWSVATHPTDFPAGAHFSSLVGATHRDGVTFWAPGGIATDGMEEMAELGGTATLTDEVDVAIAVGDADQVLSGGFVFPSPGSTGTSFTASRDFSRVTLVTMIAPSPDWFVGVSGLELHENGDWVAEKVVPLLPWDAGTDAGTTFTSPNDDVTPHAPIAAITGYPFAGGVPLGTFTFTRTDAPTPGIPALSGWGAALLAGAVIVATWRVLARG